MVLNRFVKQYYHLNLLNLSASLEGYMAFIPLDHVQSL
jgi:hypothetical protein